MMLHPKYEAFCRSFQREGNATDAARDAVARGDGSGAGDVEHGFCIAVNSHPRQGSIQTLGPRAESVQVLP